MGNSEIYLIGIAVLSFLIIVFLFIRKITNSNKLKVKIETVPDSLELMEEDNSLPEEESIELYESPESQELACFYLISIDKSMFDINQIFGFLSKAHVEQSTPAAETVAKIDRINEQTPGLSETSEYKGDEYFTVFYSI